MHLFFHLNKPGHFFYSNPFNFIVSHFFETNNFLKPKLSNKLKNLTQPQILDCDFVLFMRN